MNNEKISKANAVKLVLNSQLLTGENRISKGKKGFAKIIETLGYIQIDTISVINRAHHHIIWSRRNDYSEKYLHDLQTKDKLVFEYWTHAMSYVPMKDYRFCLHRMKNFENPQSSWLKYRFNQSQKYFKPVLEKIKNEGMQSSSNFENEDGYEAGNWWHWKPVKTALEYLFWKGDLMVAERRGFQKYYDLTERVLPQNIDTSFPDEAELNRYFINRAVSSLGIVTEKEIQKFMQPGKADISDLQVTQRKTMHRIINEMCEAGELIPLLVENDHKLVNYALPDSIKNIYKKDYTDETVYILSPFDNLIIQRDRTKRLFDFDYTIECYLPESKRKYGYFTLPILWKNNLIGRMDTKADRKSKIFIINNIVFEEGFNDFKNFIPHFNEKLKSFAEFNNCEKIEVKKCSPNKVKKMLNTKF